MSLTVYFVLQAKNVQFKLSELGLPLSPTGMAGHAVDEDVEVVETEGFFHVVAAASAGTGPEVASKILRLPFLPPPSPPLIPQNVCIQPEERCKCNHKHTFCISLLGGRSEDDDFGLWRRTKLEMSVASVDGNDGRISPAMVLT
ncbi:Hypothetical predicted protein [Olea europaea subsp. europaea]|uniref:Uncharacterized protein n=1 Tax=Olea europaea subsp. europaea TaxID=158383 RepID=A0A8S0PJN4_OLEEU|nr:Hypothetical predicted protein [Olea europaea subsp. europaea]